MSQLKEFRHIILKPADNGFVLEFTKVMEKPGSMDNRDFVNHQLIFTNDQIDDAMAKMKELFMFNKTIKGNAEMAIPSTDGSVVRSA